MKTIFKLGEHLKKNGLVHEYIFSGKYSVTLPEELGQHEIDNLSYNSSDKNLNSATLFIVKGDHFKKEYLIDAVKKGIKFYVSEIDYEIPNTVVIIVGQIELAMASLAQYFYDFPEEKIRVIGVTGTKGKTTTTYFLKDILSHSNLPAGLINSKEIITGKEKLEANLTTPESLDTYHYLNDMVKNGLKYCVLEVSSQGYKKNRLHGLRFDYGIFLNFSPDHVGTGEHESMNDYFYCKRQLLHHSDTVILNNKLDQLDFIIKDTKENNQILKKIIIFAEESNDQVDYTFKSTDIDHFTMIDHKNSEELPIELSMLGYYNHENAIASLIVGKNLGEKSKEMARKIKKTDVSGRFEVYKKNDQIIVIDSAHNETSYRNIIRSARQYYGKNRPITILGNASGNKAENRRPGFARVYNEEKPRKVYIAKDSPNFSTTKEIGQEIINETRKLDSNISFDTTYQDNRPKQIQKALNEMKENEILFILGKGTDKTQRVLGKLEPYIGDEV
ncbi:MAG: hypothetical protein L0I93_08030, partial [Atopostipes suicloacalis]|nr:hypothetical protein [Atopostipes suicloacalis]